MNEIMENNHPDFLLSNLISSNFPSQIKVVDPNFTAPLLYLPKNIEVFIKMSATIGAIPVVKVG